MLREVLISFHPGCKVHKNELRSWLEEEGFSVSAINEARLVTSEEEMEKQVTRSILLADIVCILLGPASFERPWIHFEIAVAQKVNRPIVLIEVPGYVKELKKAFKHLTVFKYHRKKIVHALKTFY